MLSPQQRQQLIKQELHRRQQIQHKFMALANLVLSLALPYQKAIIEHPSKRKAFCATRRSGKSYLVGILLIITCLLYPRCNCVYLGLTNKSAIKVVWNDILLAILLKLNLMSIVQFKMSDQELHFANGSIIYIAGADATPKQKENLRGVKYRLAVVDECQSFRQDVRELAMAVLGPGLRELQGTLILLGTPGNNTSETNYWFRVAGPLHLEKEFATFTASWKDNIAIEPTTGQKICDIIQEDIDKEIAITPRIVKTTWFRQEYLGEWCIDDNLLIYKITDDNLCYEHTLPKGFLNWKETKYVLGVDFGYFPDPCAFVIGAFNPQIDNILYIMESYSQTKMTVRDAADQIKIYREKYNPEVIVVDGSNLQIVEEIKRVHNLPLITAEKSSKAAFQQMLNSDLVTLNVKIVMPTNELLTKQMQTLIWDEKKFKETGLRKEIQTMHNDYCLAVGTLITTDKGDKPIEDIRIGNYVLTESGWQLVEMQKQTGIQPIYEVITKNGRKLRGAADHKIFIGKRRVPICELKRGDILTCIGEHPCQRTENQSASNITASFTEDIQTLKSEAKEFIGQANILTEQKCNIYTEPFGQNTMVQSLKDTWFITLMTILSTMKSLIFNFFHVLNTKVCIPLKDGLIQNIEPKNYLIWRQLEILPKNGTLHQQELNGTSNTAKSVGKIKPLINRMSAKFAKRSSIPELIEPMFVQEIVLPDNEDNRALTMKSETVSNVINNLSSINTPKPNVVPDYVAEVKELNLSLPVYNLTVANEHQYFANGILVSNCDALLYLWRYSRHLFYRPKLDMSFIDKTLQQADQITAMFNRRNNPYD